MANIAKNDATHTNTVDITTYVVGACANQACAHLAESWSWPYCCHYCGGSAAYHGLARWDIAAHGYHCRHRTSSILPRVATEKDEYGNLLTRKRKDMIGCLWIGWLNVFFPGLIKK